MRWIPNKMSSDIYVLGAVQVLILNIHPFKGFVCNFLPLFGIYSSVSFIKVVCIWL